MQKRSTYSTGVRARLGAIAVVLASALLFAFAVPAWADGSLFGTLLGKAASGASQQAEEDEPELPEFKLNKTAFSMGAGDVRPLKIAGGPVDEAVGDVTWESSDAAVATVDELGLLTARAKGTATITASIPMGAGIATASCEVTVVNDRVETAAEVLFASEHDYANGCSDVWVYSNQYVTGCWFTFDGRTEVEEGFDFIEIRDAEGALVGRYTGTELSDETRYIEGTGFSITLVSDEENTAWGFELAAFMPVYREGWVDDGVNVYYIVNGERAKELWQIDGTWHWFDPVTGAWGEKPVDVAIPDGPFGVEVEDDPSDAALLQVPTVTNMTLWEARDYLATLGLGCDDQWTTESNAPYGTVIVQEPWAGTWVEPGSGVLVTVSAGPAQVNVPDVYGAWYEDAFAAMAWAGLTYTEEWRYDDYMGWGVVIGQDPAGASLAEAGTSVTLYISAGPAPASMVEVPYVVDMYYWDAAAELVALGLNVAYEWVSDEYVEAGFVTWQAPWYGAVIPVGDTVTLTVSTGPTGINMYDYTGWWYRNALDDLWAGGYQVVINEDRTADVPTQEGTVWATDPAPGTVLTDGQTVCLYIYGKMNGEAFVQG